MYSKIGSQMEIGWKIANGQWPTVISSTVHIHACIYIILYVCKVYFSYMLYYNSIWEEGSPHKWGTGTTRGQQAQDAGEYQIYWYED